MSDYTVGDTCYFLFTTRQFSTGAPFTLAGTPVVSAYENDSVTQITSGVSLSVGHDSVTGLNLVTVVASGANGFEAGKDYHLVITTGTVDSVSVVGEVVGRFTLSRSAAVTEIANGTYGLSAIETLVDGLETTIGAAGAGLSAVPWNASWDAEVQSEVNDGLVAYNAASTTNITAGTITNVTTVNGLAAGVITAASIAADAITDAKVASDVTIASVTGAVGSVTGAVGSVTGAVGSVTGNVGGNVTGSVGSVVGAVGSVTGAVGSVTGLTASDVGAIKAKTDSLTFTQAGNVDANVRYANGALVNGDGTPGNEWGP